MKVKCIKIYNDYTKKYQETSPWLTIGKEYVVLEIMMSIDKELLYRLVSDSENKMPALFQASQFEITSDLIPSNWQIKVVNKSLIVLGPKDWRRNEFWDACYEQDPKALEIYKREAKVIYEEENAV